MSEKLSKNVKNETEEINPKSVTFIGDVLPYYLPCAFFMFEIFSYFYLNGNLTWIMFIGYLFNFPWSGASFSPKESNMSRVSEKIF